MLVAQHEPADAALRARAAHAHSGAVLADPRLLRGREHLRQVAAHRVAALRPERRVGRTRAAERVQRPLERDRVVDDPDVVDDVVRAALLEHDVRRPGERLRLVGRHDLVLLGRDDRVGRRRRCLLAGVELLHERRAGRLLGARPAADPAERRRQRVGGAVAGRREADDVVDHVELAAEARDVAAEHPALRVADERHLGGAGLGPHLVDERGELVGGLVDRSHAALHQVEREHAVAVLDERGREQVPRRRHVPERAVHEDHRNRMRGRAAREVVGPRRADAGRLRAGRCRPPPSRRRPRAGRQRSLPSIRCSGNHTGARRAQTPAGSSTTEREALRQRRLAARSPPRSARPSPGRA